MKVIATTSRTFRSELKQVVERAALHGGQVEDRVNTILQMVKKDGDAALIRYTKQFDRLALRASTIRVPFSRMKASLQQIGRKERQALRHAASRIQSFHQRQRTKTWTYTQGGVKLGQMVTPLQTVGLYVPGGKAVYPSSVLMNAIPAKVAGVPRVVMCTPLQKTGVSPYLLAAASIAGVDEVFGIGGAQAIAAMAYGTKTIPRVDKIVGPGNIYVATAKRLLFGTVGIDMVAGPSELLVIADRHADPAHVAADLLCEAEHDEEAKVYLVSTSKPLVEAVVRQVREQLQNLSRQSILSQSVLASGVAFIVKDMKEAIRLANDIAPEHLSLSIAKPQDYLSHIHNAGAIFLGRYTPPAVADYIAGPNHVLPTGGTARFFSPLGVEDYVKKTNIVSYTKKELASVQEDIVTLAEIEGLDAHSQSTKSRFS